MAAFLAELKQYGALYALEGILPMWAVKLFPNFVLTGVDRLLWK